METLRSTTLNNLDINPFLMKVLNFKTPEDILEFNLYQTVTRSIVTSWGMAVEGLLFRCGADKFISGDGVLCFGERGKNRWKILKSDRKLRVLRCLPAGVLADVIYSGPSFFPKFTLGHRGKTCVKDENRCNECGNKLPG
jgi:hypothetical protein